MKNYMESVGGLRKAMIADIEEYLREANRSIVVKAGHISYLCYNLAFNSTNEDELQCVPDVEIRMLAHDKDFGFRFVDAHNHEGVPTELSTDELWTVCDYLLLEDLRQKIGRQ